MKLIIPYKLEFANVVASFIEEVGVSYGADDDEKKQLRLIGEEAFSLIIGGIPDREFTEMFHLHCVEMEDKISFQFSNHGRPMDVREIREFTIEDTEGTADGLSLSLLRGYTDELLFRNLGNEGWELVINFRIKNFNKINGRAAVISDETQPDQLQDYVIRRSVVDDIPGIINLVYNTYRYSYIKSFAYSKELFKEALESGKIFSMIVVSKSGKIIGHNAIIFDSPRLGEVGMAMIDPAYRRSRAFFSLIGAMKNEVLQTNPELVLYSKAVTSHKSSQAFMFNFYPCLLQVSVYKHASFIGIQGELNPRESLIFGYVSISSNPSTITVFVPVEHHAIIQAILNEGRIPVTLIISTGEFSGEKSQMEVQADLSAEHAFLHFSSIGADFGKVLRQQTKALQKDDVNTIYAIIPTDENIGGDINQALFQNGYFFSGIKPNEQGGWDLFYANLLHQKFNFDNIQLFNPKAVDLCNYVKALYGQLD
ncbi:MAG: hypothetical protein NT004_04975 [Bacteroidetes bacterium]|nr:hypothetical protein [Bacteroidota bacterium]